MTIVIHIAFLTGRKFHCGINRKLNPVMITVFWCMTSYCLVNGYLCNCDNVKYHINSGNSYHYSITKLRYYCLAPWYGRSPNSRLKCLRIIFTNVPVDEALQVIRNKLHNDDTLAERSVLQVEAIMVLL
jgi:hypothetical protein